MEENPILHPVVPYQMMNEDHVRFMGQGKEYTRILKACDKAYERFEKLRAGIITDAIAVEKELERVIAWYFVPRLDRANNSLVDEEDIRRDAIVDLLLGHENASFRLKCDVVSSIIRVGEIKKHPKLTVILQAVMNVRNQFAHRRVAIDWQTQKAALWDSKKQKWGCAVFKPDGTPVDTDKAWNDRIPDDFGEWYHHRCRSAVTLLNDVWSEVKKLRAPSRSS